MIQELVYPQSTLAIILGASIWPQSGLTENPSFLNSAHAFIAYLLDKKGFNLPREQVLDLFDCEGSPTDILLRIGKFIDAQDNARVFTDLIFYYVGHGLFQGQDRHYHLALRSTETNYEDITSLRMADLARRLKRGAAFKRRFIFLDSCFSGSAVRTFQSGQAHVAVQKTLRSFPSRGTAIYCSSNRDDPSLAPEDSPFTMFSGALIQALRKGLPDLGPRLTMKELDRLVWNAISDQYSEGSVRPELHCPDQSEGDLGELPIFPNPGWKDQAEWTIKSVFHFGRLSVSSTQGGALSLDGRFVKELAPFEICHIENIRAGNYELVIKAPGVRDVAERVLVRPDEALARDYDPPLLAADGKTPNHKQKKAIVAEIKSRPVIRNQHKAGQIQLFSDAGFEIEMAWCPPGKFKMGSPENELDRYEYEFQHVVVLTHGFWLGRTAVTQREWAAVMGDHPSEFKGEKRPVENVSWKRAQLFIAALNQSLGQEVFRLPTEAEWEYACRAGTVTPYAGDLDEMCWYDENSENKTHDVAKKAPNRWGLYDMHGNVWEWCADWFDAYSTQEETDPQGAASGSARVVRGGSWGNSAGLCRSANRGWEAPGDHDGFVGFRLLRNEHG